MLDAGLKKEVIRMCIGVSVLSAVMVFVFALFGKVDMPVIYGTVLGVGVTLLNYFFLALSVSHIANSDIASAKLFMNISYFARIILVAGAVIIAIKLPYFNYLAVVLPLVFERIVIMIIHAGGWKNEHTGA